MLLNLNIHQMQKKFKLNATREKKIYISVVKLQVQQRHKVFLISFFYQIIHKIVNLWELILCNNDKQKYFYIPKTLIVPNVFVLIVLTGLCI